MIRRCLAALFAVALLASSAYAQTVTRSPETFTITTQVFTASGTYTPTAGTKWVEVHCLGAGAGGGGVLGTTSNEVTAGGGGAGSESVLFASITTIGASQTVTIGAAGSGATAGANNGTSGGDTSLGSLCIGKGGSAGVGTNLTTTYGGGGLGGVAGTGTLTPTGMSGTQSTSAFFTGLQMAGGVGGSSSQGGGGNNSTCVTTPLAGTGYGSGGAGACLNGTAASVAGGAGTGGKLWVVEYHLQ